MALPLRNSRPTVSLFIMAGKTQKNLKHEVPKAPDIALRGLTD
jgi:hypothetical protein